MEYSWCYIPKTKLKIPYDPEIPLCGCKPKKHTSICCKRCIQKIYTRLFIGVLLTGVHQKSVQEYNKNCIFTSHNITEEWKWSK